MRERPDQAGPSAERPPSTNRLPSPVRFAAATAPPSKARTGAPGDVVRRAGTSSSIHWSTARTSASCSTPRTGDMTRSGMLGPVEGPTSAGLGCRTLAVRGAAPPARRGVRGDRLVSQLGAVIRRRLARSTGRPATVIYDPGAGIPARRGAFDLVVSADQGEPRARKGCQPPVLAGRGGRGGRRQLVVVDGPPLHLRAEPVRTRAGPRAGPPTLPRCRATPARCPLARLARAAAAIRRLVPSSPAYALPSHAFPRFVVGNERGCGLGLA